MAGAANYTKKTPQRRPCSSARVAHQTDQFNCRLSADLAVPRIQRMRVDAPGALREHMEMLLLLLNCHTAREDTRDDDRRPPAGHIRSGITVNVAVVMSTQTTLCDDHAD